MAKALTFRVLCDLANGVLARKNRGSVPLDPSNNFSVYIWQGALDRLHESGELSDDEYLAYLDLFPEELYETPMRRLFFVH